jgi:hypothetical protein
MDPDVVKQRIIATGLVFENPRRAFGATGTVFERNVFDKLTAAQARSNPTRNTVNIKALRDVLRLGAL